MDKSIMMESIAPKTGNVIIIDEDVYKYSRDVNGPRIRNFMKCSECDNCIVEDEVQICCKPLWESCKNTWKYGLEGRTTIN